MVDVELYGGRNAFLAHIRARALYALGAYRSARDVEWATVRRLAFVCKGNICRSPYACAKARSMGVQAVSFGIDAADGAPAAPAAAENALLRGIDLSEHRSSRVQSDRLAEGDLLIAFEPRQIVEVRRRIGAGTSAELLGIWSRPIRPYIHDPYGMSDRYFQQCFSVIDASIARLIECMARSGAPAINNGPVRGTEPAMNRQSCEGTLG